MPSSTLRHRKVDIVHLAEGRVVERIEAHRHALQAGLAQGMRLSRQQRAVGGQRQFEAGDRRQHLDQPLDVAPEQRLAAGQADLGDAVLDE